MGLIIWATIIVAIFIWLLFPDKSSFYIKDKPTLISSKAVKIKKEKPISKGEFICKEMLEKTFNKPFTSIRPIFLKNPKTGKNLEIDCYNEELKLAIEYNGQQHYRVTNRFHKSEQDFISQVDRDDFKKKKLKEMGITLISVPYTVPYDLIPSYLLKKLLKKGFGQYMNNHQNDEENIV